MNLPTGLLTERTITNFKMSEEVLIPIGSMLLCVSLSVIIILWLSVQEDKKWNIGLLPILRIVMV